MMNHLLCHYFYIKVWTSILCPYFKNQSVDSSILTATAVTPICPHCPHFFSSYTIYILLLIYSFFFFISKRKKYRQYGQHAFIPFVSRGLPVHTFVKKVWTKCGRSTKVWTLRLLHIYRRNAFFPSFFFLFSHSLVTSSAE